MFAHYKVKAGKVIRFDLLESFTFPYLDTFEDFCWTNYLKMIYENLVKVFYYNFELVPKLVHIVILTLIDLRQT